MARLGQCIGKCLLMAHLGHIGSLKSKLRLLLLLLLLTSFTVEKNSSYYTKK